MSKKEKKRRKRRLRRLRNRISCDTINELPIIDGSIKEYHYCAVKIKEKEERLKDIKARFDSMKGFQFWKINEKRKLKQQMLQLELIISQDVTKLHSVYFEAARIYKKGW